MSVPTAVLDANVPHPAPLRDLLIELAFGRLYRARWTRGIEDEWMRNLLANRPDLSPARIGVTRDRMNVAIPDALVVGHEALIPELHLPDAHDRHVLAAAIRAPAYLIVTRNVRDFPAVALAAHGIAAIPPDRFITDLIAADSRGVVACVGRGRDRLARPAMTAEAYLGVLARQGLVATAERLRTPMDDAP